MEWTWGISYTPAAFESIVAAAIQIDDVSYELVDTRGDVVWSAPIGNVRNVTRGAVVEPNAPAAPTA